MVKRSQNGRKKEPFNCELFQQQITAFLFRDLPANTELFMEQQQNSCTACREALARAIPIDCTHVFQHISSYIDDEVPADLRARMEAH
jgi:anti-sigma factor RsiW